MQIHYPQNISYKYEEEKVLNYEIFDMIYSGCILNDLSIHFNSFVYRMSHKESGTRSVRIRSQMNNLTSFVLSSTPHAPRASRIVVSTPSAPITCISPRMSGLCQLPCKTALFYQIRSFTVQAILWRVDI